MDFQTMYQLYDYYCRMYVYYEIRWTDTRSVDFHLASEFLILGDYFERALRNF